MRERYSYQIQTRDSDDTWHSGILREDSFARDPKAIARSLLERWVIDHPGRAGGGVRLVVTNSAQEPEYLHPTVRVRVYRGGLGDRGSAPVATAYLGYELEGFEQDTLPWSRFRSWLHEEPALREYDDAA